jgi:hypothetical protein
MFDLYAGADGAGVETSTRTRSDDAIANRAITVV